MAVKKQISIPLPEKLGLSHRTRDWLETHDDARELCQAIASLLKRRYELPDKEAKNRSYNLTCAFFIWLEERENQSRTTESVNWTALRNKPTTTTVAAVRWVAAHLDDLGVDLNTAPSPTAVSMLHWAREDRREFYKTFAQQMASSELKAEGTKDDDSDPDRDLHTDLDAYLEAAEAEFSSAGDGIAALSPSSEGHGGERRVPKEPAGESGQGQDASASDLEGLL